MFEERYNHQKIEKKWREHWAVTKENKTGEETDRPKYYCLDMFPYPSGSGLHVGHWRGYVLSDVWSRYKKMNGYNVLHPMGWDAFGLPAENDAIKKGIHPSISTARNVANFKRQLDDMGAMYDWEREVNTTDPDYYKWTQWIFLKMYEMGLAYEKEMPINWCPSCKTGLANEEVVGGECERCGTLVTKKNLKQWMLKITAYAERLLDDLKLLDWPERIIKMQANWIGKSQGAEIDFDVDGNENKIKVFTTRPDTLFGATYMVLAPEHDLVLEISTPEQKQEVENYIEFASRRSNIERMTETKDKTGVFTGAYAINPLNGTKLPIWISDYVLMDYGTGAIMSVPAHDDRDFAFAKVFNLPIIRVIAETAADADKPLDEPYTGAGVLVNSGKYSSLSFDEAKKAIVADLATEGKAKATVNYKLRDWVFSRQRYWGEPIPIIHCAKCGTVPVPEEQLPVKLPDVKRYEPTGTGESPLAGIEEWVNTTCPTCGGKARRETNTMPQWAGSSWYFLRYADPRNNQASWDVDKVNYWLPVDLYVGGAEHAVLHLLYARFFTKVLYDVGVVGFLEPFKRLFNQGVIYRNGARMSKSRGNVVNPDELVEKYGGDSLRLYELFIGPPEQDTEWDDNGIEGVYRFLNRAWRLVVDNYPANAPARPEITRAINVLAKDITERMNDFRFNTVVSTFMSFVNNVSKEAQNGGIDRNTLKNFVGLLAPFVPHFAEELWETMGNKGSIFRSEWPTYDEKLTEEDVVTIVIQVNGKVKGKLEVAKGSDKDAALAKAKELQAVEASLQDKAIVKEIFVPDKLLNIVVR